MGQTSGGERSLCAGVEVGAGMAEWVHGIPTVDDVTDSAFLEARKRENLVRQVEGMLSGLANSTWLHNRVVGAQRRLGRDVVNVDRFIRAGKFDKRFLSLINSSEVASLAVELAERFRQEVAMIEVSEAGRIFERPRKYISTGELDFFGLEVTVKQEGKFFEHTFVPLKLLKAIATDFCGRAEAIKGYREQSKPLAVYLLLAGYSQNRTISMLSTSISLERGSMYAKNLGEGEAAELLTLNREIAAMSEISVRFDSEYLEMKVDGHSISIPFASMFGDFAGEPVSVLGHRALVRDVINTPTIEGRCRYINGVKLWQDINHDWHFEADKVPKWLQNALGETMINKRGDKVEPASWAAEERLLVDELRKLSDDQILDVKKPPASAVWMVLQEFDCGAFGQLSDPASDRETLLHNLKTSTYRHYFATR